MAGQGSQKLGGTVTQRTKHSALKGAGQLPRALRVGSSETAGKPSVLTNVNARCWPCRGSEVDVQQRTVISARRKHVNLGPVGLESPAGLKKIGFVSQTQPGAAGFDRGRAEIAVGAGGVRLRWGWLW